MILHNSHFDFYRSPFGAVSCNQEIILRLEIKRTIKAQGVTVRLWQDGQGEKRLKMKVCETRENCVIYQAQFTAPTTPGLIWYYFIVTEGAKTYYYGTQGDILGGEGQVYNGEPPSYQITVYKRGAITPAWFKDAVMYQIFPDRFYNGTDDGSVLSPKQGTVIHAHWDNTPYYIRDVDTKRIVAYDFFGGNLSGVIKKLPYLKELGISVIYFNPIVLSPSNHRYDTADYKTVDPMLGDNNTFAQLCAKAKEYGISVILDGVFSHTGSDSIYFNKEGNFPGVGAYQSQESPYYKWYRFSQYPHQYESWWGIDTMPNVEEMEPSYIDYIIEGQDSVIKHWMKLGAKGWRLDVADELPDAFIQKIYKTMKHTDPDSVLIGEVWEDASRKQSYGQLRQYLQGEELDSVMNYPFRDATMDFLLYRADADKTHRVFMSIYEHYPKENFYALMNLIGTHDVPRALTLLGEAPPSESLAIEEQYRYRLPKVRRDMAVARLKLMALWQMTFPGVPCVYYGDEAGLEGYKDPFNRGTYPWGHEDQELLAWYKQVIALRNEHDMLKTGEFISLPAQRDVYGYIRRIYNRQDVFGKESQDGTALVLFNRRVAEAVTVELYVRPWLHGRLQNVLNHSEVRVVEGKVKVTLQPLEGVLLLQEQKDALPRECGVLLHPTSLPAKYGMGDLGKDAYDFIDFLHAGGQKLWQVLPLNPVGFGESPYQCLSAFAGHQLLISPGKLVSQGFLPLNTLKNCPDFNQQHVEFERVSAYKEGLFRSAYDHFSKDSKPAGYDAFREEHGNWLEDYALFIALRKHFGGIQWNLWPEDIARRRPEAMDYYRQSLAKEIEYQIFLQYIFFSQWQALKEYAGKKGIKIIGDIPIFVAHDSSDVWAHQQLFDLDVQGKPKKVAGVPPDYFSATGQLWGNPHYKWDEMAKDEYLWWRERFSVLFKLVDIVRVDHFRGFESYWEVAGDADTAIHGKWVKGPGKKFFAVLEKYFGPLPIIVEDLGIITSEVEDLKYDLEFPGIKVMHFSFQLDINKKCLPVICEKNLVAYTGTHDNDTTCGWYSALLQEQPELAAAIRQYLGLPEGGTEEVCRKLIEFSYAGSANTVIIPLQDFLELGTECRMNFPGTVGAGNWAWRCPKDHLSLQLSRRMRELAEKYQR